jgi:hypothetical protein
LALSGTAYSLEGHLFKNIVASNETASFEDNILKPI